MTNLLEVKNLRVKFPSRTGVVKAVRNISFSLGKERLGIVGESGSGKSITARAILRLIKKPGIASADHILLAGQDLLKLSEKAMRSIRGHRISMVMQDPKFSLNPVMRAGTQICEAYRLHAKVGRREAVKKTIEMLETVLIRDPQRVFKAYPHEISSGMAQRVMIAMMLIPDPQILIADEPTSALDVTVQKNLLDIMDKLVRERDMGLIFISHDLNVVAAFCDRVLIMYAGKIVETCRADELNKAKHGYTQNLLKSLPQLERRVERLETLQRDDAWGTAPSVSGIIDAQRA